jgi:hypothetical protein
VYECSPWIPHLEDTGVHSLKLVADPGDHFEVIKSAFDNSEPRLLTQF